MTRRGIGRVADLRLRLLDDLVVADPGRDWRLLRGSVCAFLEQMQLALSV